jgi:subtilisin-like proprotein convertase family protein
MRTAWIAWIGAGIALGTTTAHADVLRASREQPMFEVSHAVDIRIADGVATYTVRRMFSNPGTVADQVVLELGLPYGAAATGLRIRAADRWYDGVLMERDQAAALYHEMTGFGAHAPKDPALLAWMWADKLSLQVFPVMPGAVSTVEYTLTAPTRYEGGRYFVSYPRVAADAQDGDGQRANLRLATPIITVHPAWGNATTAIIVDGKRVAPDSPVVLTPPVREPWADVVEADSAASYVASTIEIPASSHTTKTFGKTIVELALAHTFQSDLEVELLTPQNKRIKLHDRKGGGANDLRGTFTLELPKGTTGAGTWRLIVSDHAALDTGTLDHWSLTLGEGKDATTVASADTPVFVPDAPESASDAGVAAISVVPPPIATWTARLGRVVASSAHAFSRLEVDVAPQLVPTPVRPQVVFVVDSSYSQGEAGVAAQLDLLAAYLTHVPDAQVELVTYRRRAQRVFSRFVPAKELALAIAAAKTRGAFALGNGSALDEGARLAVTALADRKGPRRVVIATDELARTTLTPALALAALAALSTDTVVHVVVPRLDGDDRPSLERHDDAAFAGLATRHHGIYVDVQGLPAKTLKELAPIALELVRPTRIEKLAITGGFTVERDVLREGDGLRLMRDTTHREAPTRVVLTGKLWSDPVRREVATTAAFSRDTAAFVFGADEHQGLSPAEQMVVALAGRAVSPVTSYVAAEPGTRPSTIGLDLATLGHGGYGTIGHGYGGGGLGMGREQPDLRSLIDASHCIATVRPTTAWAVDLSIETTKDEIVDVIAQTRGPLAACLVEAAWSVRLDTRFTLDREQFAVHLTGPATP